jgi:16S rRNA C1402 (ribose-2'-O) methylase RsmI
VTVEDAVAVQLAAEAVDAIVVVTVVAAVAAAMVAVAVVGAKSQRICFRRFTRIKKKGADKEGYR